MKQSMHWALRFMIFSLVTGVLLMQPAVAQHLSDNFTLWTASSTFLNSLAAATSSPGGTFVSPTTTFTGQTGLQMSGLTEDFTLTGLQSLAAFSAPYTVTVEVTPIEGTANPFAIYLASSDLTQYLTLHANVNPVYQGFWADASNVGPLASLGEQFSPNFVPQMGTLYKIVMNVDSTGLAAVTVFGAGKHLGTLSGLQAGTGPFYLVIGQRIGLAPTGSQVADWSSVKVVP